MYMKDKPNAISTGSEYKSGYEDEFMSGIPLQSGIIYGPILSRRLGRSLGINLLPIDRKVCTFDCVYCQYGHANTSEVLMTNDGFPMVSEVLIHVEKALKKPRTIDYLTFSGNGEPTIHPDFPEIVEGVISLRERLRPDAKLAILSNSSRVDQPYIHAALERIDVPMMKLDAGDPQTFKAINWPGKSIDFWKIVAGLRSLPNLMIQSMLIDGKVSNVRGDAFLSWVDRLIELRPREVHIYSLDRPTACDDVQPVGPQMLQSIAAELREHHQLPVKAFF
jgi:wyosine [tRNA(Phe)-imidazoG37] synthetase (radical SAM superfamily)